MPPPTFGEAKVQVGRDDTQSDHTRGEQSLRDVCSSCPTTRTLEYEFRGRLQLLRPTPRRLVAATAMNASAAVEQFLLLGDLHLQLEQFEFFPQIV